MSWKSFRYRMVPNMVRFSGRPIRSGTMAAVLRPIWSFEPISGSIGSLPISNSMGDVFRYRSLMVRVISMDHMIPDFVFNRYIGKWTISDIGSDKWSKLSFRLYSKGLRLFGPFGPWFK